MIIQSMHKCLGDIFHTLNRLEMDCLTTSLNFIEFACIENSLSTKEAIFPFSIFQVKCSRDIRNVTYALGVVFTVLDVILVKIVLYKIKMSKSFHHPEIFTKYFLDTQNPF